MDNFLSGAICMGFFVAGLFFLRFWKSSKDRFFFLFAVSFWMEAVNRVFIAYAAAHATVPERVPVLYLIRLVAFSLILVAIIDKNKPKQ